MSLVLTALTPPEFLEIVDGAPQRHFDLFEEERMSPVVVGSYRTQAVPGRSCLMEACHFLTPPGLDFRSGESLVSLNVQNGGDWLQHLSTKGCPSLLIISKEALLMFSDGLKYSLRTTDDKDPVQRFNLRALLRSLDDGKDAASVWTPRDVLGYALNEYVPILCRDFDLLGLPSQIKIVRQLFHSVKAADCCPKNPSGRKEALAILKECREVLKKIVPTILSLDEDLSSPFGDGCGLDLITEILGNIRIVEQERR